MKLSRLAFPALLALCLVPSIPSIAHADDQPPVAEQPRTDEHLRGLEVMLRPAYGAAPSDSPVRATPQLLNPDALMSGASPWGGGFVGQAFLGYRFHPVISAGFRGGFRNASGSNLSDGSTNLSRSGWDAGFYVRGYPLALSENIRKYVDPWVGVGVEYMRDSQTYQHPVATTRGPMNGDWTISHHGIAIPLGIGVDYRVHPMFSIGPSFEYAISTAIAGCQKAEAAGSSVSVCSNEGAGKNAIKADTYGVWTAGLDLKVTLF